MLLVRTSPGLGLGRAADSEAWPALLLPAQHLKRVGAAAQVPCECRGPAVHSEEQFGIWPGGLSIFPALQNYSFHILSSPFPYPFLT